MLDIIPTEDDKKKVDTLVSELLKKIKVKDAIPIVGGSTAKNTWLKNNIEIDIYVKFNYKKYCSLSSKLSDILYSQLKNKFRLVRLHGSRDYFQTKYHGHTVEIIPILDIKKSSEAKNITDISQLHVKYVRKYPKLANEIRLAKAFAKANGFYGAESHIRGFSGYVLEIMTIHYGSFKNLIKNVSKWKSLTEIGNKSLIRQLNESKRLSPLILLDPVQSDRNAAASVSQEKYSLFIRTSKAYLKKPSENFFRKKEFDVSHIKRQGIIAHEVQPLAGKRDIVGSKLLKAFEYLQNEVKSHGFKVSSHGWHWEEGRKAYFWFKNTGDLPKTALIQGPPIQFTESVVDFKKVHRKTLVKDDRVFAEERREFTNLKALLKSLVRHENVSSRVKSISFL
ncbi:MAG TPA: hypothetical protein VJC07_02230 [Candidatus Nanoarchaeia archaeon]|nr:hypothetical protein [Candidatus Nanoarchaeia archaeon]